MKRIFILVLLSIGGLLGSRLFHATDVAELLPVEVIRVRMESAMVVVETDKGQSGVGKTLEDAFEHLKKSAPGDIFLDTADYVLVTPETRQLLEQLADYLRPACKVCLEYGNAALEKVAEFLSAHMPQTSLSECRDVRYQLPVLVAQEGRMELVS